MDLCLLLLTSLEILVCEESEGAADKDQGVNADTEACGICRLGLGRGALLCGLCWRVVLLWAPK